MGTAFDRCRSVRYHQLLQQQRQLTQKRARLNAIQVSGAAREMYASAHACKVYGASWNRW